ncbi:MAG: hypothetical protein HY810_05440 [Candidatus Omnitrophica bacterium]|nr:hypothetical protein [Candidatus Omnitrophota bacterium]
MEKGKKAKCPVCGESFELEDELSLGDTTYCLDCDHELKVVKLDPPKLKPLVEYPEVYNEDHNEKRFEHRYVTDYNDYDNSDENDHDGASDAEEELDE